MKYILKFGFVKNIIYREIKIDSFNSTTSHPFATENLLLIPLPGINLRR